MGILRGNDVMDCSDGLLSESEIKRYFLLAKCSVLKNSFTHNFTETTYFKLTYCDHCSGLVVSIVPSLRYSSILPQIIALVGHLFQLWGLIKQGWRCKDCGVNAHKTCKELVATECRNKTSSKQGHTPLGTSLSCKYHWRH